MATQSRETLTLNMGPQHPATHGVLRLVLELEGEVIGGARPVIGYQHTGIEKEMETRTYHQNIVFPPRVEYLATMIEEVAYVQTVEKLMEITPPQRCQYIRVILMELSRIASHLVYLGSAGIDMNITSLWMYTFVPREKILDIFEMVSGQRMMHGYMRVGGLQWDVPEGCAARVRAEMEELPRRLDEFEALLTDNLIWRGRRGGGGGGAGGGAGGSPRPEGRFTPPSNPPGGRRATTSSATAATGPSACTSAPPRSATCRRFP